MVRGICVDGYKYLAGKYMYAHTYMLPSTLQLIGLAKDSYATASYSFFGYLYSGLTYISLVIHYSVRNLVLTGIITLHFLS